MIVFNYIIAVQPPIVLMHGFMTDKSDLDDLSAYLTEMIPDLYVLNCEVGNGYNDSIFMDIYSSVAELTKCIVNDPHLNLDFINSLIGDLEYTDFVQNLLTGASYWNDPYKHNAYLAYKTHLSYLNNEVEINSNYKSNFLEPDLYVLFGSPNDNIIVPWESAWFGFFNSDDKTIKRCKRWRKGRFIYRTHSG
ncbi:Palmitoyl-protein_thioesterase [Hexamita inflata]|uniref:palmitoyl-CoA hydrolase n=1 Tax=Hexamita inflata TaxID=28002 RepID=A0ABP1I503_9EUKA